LSHEPKEGGLPESVKRFVLTHFHSVDQLEVLLHLYRHRDREWTAEQVSADLRTNPPVAVSRLADLHARGFLARRVDDKELVYRFLAPERYAVDVEHLAQFYGSHRVRIIELIYSRPAEAIRWFADAFRIRKDDKE
jgi:hypothetical protein